MYRKSEFMIFIVMILMITMPLMGFQRFQAQEYEITRSQTDFKVADANLSRVETRHNQVENGGLEDWATDHIPEGYTTYRTVETYGWYTTTASYVNEGSRALGLQSRAIDSDHVAELNLRQNQMVSWSNPINTTMRLDYYIDSFSNPDNADAFYILVKMKSIGTRYLRYYIAGTTSASNSTYYGYIFLKDTDLGTWKTFDRNLTSDFISLFGMVPTQFEIFNIYLRSETNVYTRVYIDDFRLVNGTNVLIGGDTNHGNFELTGTGNYWVWTNSDSADISRSTIAYTGAWSGNLSVASSGNPSRAYIESDIMKCATSQNRDILSFHWRIDRLANSNSDLYAYLKVDAYNSSNDELEVYYVFSYGGSTSPVAPSNSIVINATGFNTTQTWFFFNRSVYEDVIAYNSTENLFIRRLTFFVNAFGADSRLDLLIDDLNLDISILNDRGYEDQGALGDEIIAWADCREGDTPELTVTDDAMSGAKAANLTIGESTSFYVSQNLNNLQISNTSEVVLDLYWKLLSFSGLTDETVMIGVSFESGYSIGYVLANSTPVESFGAYDKYILLPEINRTGSWFNLQRNLYLDHYTTFNISTATQLYSVEIYAETNTGGEISILFDDFYIYYDGAPYLAGLEFTPSAPTELDSVNVRVLAEDFSLNTVTLHYRVNSGSWINSTMTLLGDSQFTGTIAAQEADAVVEFYVSAIDNFSQVSVLMNGTDFFKYTVEESSSSLTTSTTPTTTSPTTSPVPPMDLMPLLIAVIVIGAAIVVTLYFVVLRPRQNT